MIVCGGHAAASGAADSCCGLKMSGRSSSFVTAPSVARSISMAYRGGTGRVPRSICHRNCCVMPIARQNAALLGYRLTAFSIMQQVKHSFSDTSKHWLVPLPTPQADNSAMLKEREEERLAMAARLREALACCASKTQVAEACGVTVQALTGWEKTGRVDKRHLPTIAKMSGKSLDWLMGVDMRLRSVGLQEAANGYIVACSKPAGDAFPRTPSEQEYVLVPQYTAKGACGAGHMNGHVEVKGGLAFKRDWLAELGVKPEDAAVIYASGESMAPTIEDGAVVMLDCSQKEVRPGKAYAFLAGDEVRIKRAFQSVTGQWRLASDNPNKAQYPDEVIHEPGELSVIGRCMWQGGPL